MATKTADTPRAAQKAAPKAAAGPETYGGALLQRVIFPRIGDPLDVRALYLDEDTGNARRARSLSRTALQIGPDSEISFATYFNGFAASYWRRWTTLESVVLRLNVSAACRVDVYRSKGDGTQIHVRGLAVAKAGPVSFDLELAPFEDGGWYWFNVTSESDDLEITDSGWYATSPAPGRGSVSISITTFNRPDDCVGALTAIGEDDLVLAAITAVVVADQGTKKVRDATGYAEAAARLGDRLRMRDQANMGGSGGFARGMFEAVTDTDCDQVLLMDDDIVIEPDCILRALAFSRFAAQPMIVGGHMLNLQARSHLHSMGEIVDRGPFMWNAAPYAATDHDFVKRPLRHPKSVNLHRRIDVDYNGWWMCMIPRRLVEELGLPLPLFIKWDDSEYSLRAAAAGYPTASLPGVAIWHMPWSNKDDGTDWQAYFHFRNRLIVAALYSDDRKPRGLVKSSLRSTLVNLLSLQYSTVALHHRAIQDFMAGPDRLFEMLPTALAEVRELRAQFDDGRVVGSARDLPLPSMTAAHAAHFSHRPDNPIAMGRTLLEGLVHNLRKPRPEHHERPQLNISAQDARWYLMSRIDGATVATADGRGTTFRKRDPEKFRMLMRQAVQDFMQLEREFERLKGEYRAALRDLTSIESWRKVFEQQ
ncbi:glycosyltransferase [Actinocrispum wychmicini]|uniref:Galactofuranosylgalactofuranosylrhamnosyl-N-acetylglucosaminyl-diphospho-decaprenol beta-1,5/1,6-galactofuranosyltransferase n=1 Tax=Actinocrispum wychmicini TaxID=1213861 RepID=A0A4R2JX82_9PSEU|nr:glycosyltransferase [Actinocrispum wychmicini]TCO64474.1 galactofuranosylgalactofuranosylrhamnosyl-N-acetylglucosaminyl-diphospho-decaprenol beta-1,5/1,6-galactofuranosyltransferase [Actinocrispum wychmicini]